MKILEIKNKGSIPFPDGITWTPGDDSKIAIVGDNGSGKTTLLDTLSMAFYGVTPNRRSESGREEGAIYGCFKDKTSSIEVKAEFNGKLIHVKRLIDPIAKTQKPYLYVDGKAVTEGKLKEFQEKFLEHTDLPEELFLSALYHSQKGKGHIVSLDQAGSRELLGNLLGFQEYDSEFELLESERKALESSIAADDVLFKNLNFIIEGESNAQNSLSDDLKEKTKVEGELLSLEKVLSEIQQRLADYKAGSTEVRELIESKKTLSADKEVLEKEIEDLSERLRNNEALKEKEPEIRTAVEKKNCLEKEISELDKSILEIKTKIDIETKAIENSNKEVTLELEKLENQKTSTRNEFDTANTLLSEYRSKLAKLTSEVTECQKKASLLERVPCNGVEVSGKQLTEACELLADAVKSKGRIEELQKEFDSITLQVESQVKKIDSSKLEMQRIDSEKLLTSEKLKTFDSVKELRNKEDEIRKQISEKKTEISTFDETLKHLAHLDLIDERIRDYQAKIDISTNKKKDLESKLSEIESLITAKQSDVDGQLLIEKELSEARSKKTILNQRRDELVSNISKFESKLLQVKEAKEKLESLGTKTKLERLGRIKNLCEALSPKGVRALKLDASGPEISATINDVLSECYGSRFQVSFKTTKETGKGTIKEDFSIAVYDEETGEETFVDNKSGGQEAIIKEGISLGVAVYKIQKTGKAIETLIRDEADGGLTQKNAYLYQKMLDKAMTLGGFKQVIFVSHKPEIQDLADCVFRVADGKIEKTQREVISL
ncbi:AAA family ATPase [Leptospira bandrabouensis]|uniref:AAA family ATPase n=1 Tax=Leptospira bandrabouensis TaxID=2484903 RepID=UPI0010916C71|nr:SMC family ATPase [Leptospira bandrabouensis]TGN08593.1 SMC family ATPase [Leptospira bandrabouensis]